MENKYYTPEISEFFVGFEYEYLAAPNLDRHINNGFIKKVCTPNYLISAAGLIKNYPKAIRVKYLDKSDIESFGFNIKSESHPWFKAADNNGPDAMYFNKFIDKVELILFYSIEINKLEIHIQIPCNKDYTTYQSVFIGIIKNKSELIKLLKMLNINA